jgi:hypothetical protein
MAMTFPRRMGAPIFLLMALSDPLMAAKAPKVPDDAPYCAEPGTRQLFVSPMGEPFRAPAGQPYPSAAWAAGADRDHDGAIDRQEFLADAQRFFRTLDKDHDGKLTPEEVTAYENEVAPEIALYRGRQMLGVGRAGEQVRGERYEGGFGDLVGVVPQRRARDGESNYGGPMGAGRYAWLNIPEPVSATDADIDRVVDPAEFAAAAGRRFDTLAAGRATLKLADLGKTPAQMSLEGPCVSRPKPRKGDERRDGAEERKPGEGKP